MSGPLADTGGPSETGGPSGRGGQSEKAAPFSARVCDAATLFAAIWTVACHLAVAIHGSLHLAMASFAVLAVLALGAWLVVRRRTPGTTSTHPAPGHLGSDPRGERGLRVAAGVLGLAAWAAWLATGDVALLWWSAVGVLAYAAIVLAARERSPGDGSRAWSGTAPETALWLTGAACTLIALTFHRPDYDSAFYVSLAVAAADHPGAPLMLDTIHGVESLAVHQPAHRVHTFEVFQGAVSWLTGLRAIDVYYRVVPAFSACLVPLAWARLFRELAPRHWPWAVMAVLVVLVGGDGGGIWYGTFALERIVNGKSVYLSVFLPLAWAYGLRFGAQPTLRRFWLLAAVQIAAVGCTSSAIWSVPIAAGAAALCAVRWDPRAIKTLAAAVLASAYAVGVGVSLVSDMAPIGSSIPADLPAATRLTSSLARALGTGRLEAFALFALLLVPALYRGGTARRFAIGVPLIALLFVLNPYIEETIARYVTGPSIWRSMWALPLPALMALTLVAPLQLVPSVLGRRASAAGVLLGVAAFLLLVPGERATPKRDGRIEFGGLRVSRGNLQVAQVLSSSVPPGSMVVAPEPVAVWVAALHDHPAVASSREGYLRRIAAELGVEEADRRMNLSEQVSRPRGKPSLQEPKAHRDGIRRRSRHPDRIAWFREGLRRYDVKGVCIDKGAPGFGAVTAVLLDEGFRRVYDERHHQIWIAGATPG